MIPKYTFEEALGTKIAIEELTETPEVVDEAYALLSGKLDINDWLAQ